MELAEAVRTGDTLEVREDTDIFKAMRQDEVSCLDRVEDPERMPVFLDCAGQREAAS